MSISLSGEGSTSSTVLPIERARSMASSIPRSCGLSHGIDASCAMGTLQHTSLSCSAQKMSAGLGLGSLAAGRSLALRLAPAALCLLLTAAAPGLPLVAVGFGLPAAGLLAVPALKPAWREAIASAWGMAAERVGDPARRGGTRGHSCVR